MVVVRNVSKWFGDLVAVSDVSFAIGFGLELIDGNSRLGRSHLSGVDFVVAEVFLLEEVLLESVETVALHALGIPLDLNLHVPRGRPQRRCR